MGKEVIRHDEIQGDILHEYDGIEEADNRLPNWWLAIFYGSIVFAVFYWFYYHEYEIGRLPMAAYMNELESQSGDGANVSEDVLVALRSHPGAVAEGKSSFIESCAPCHEASGGGKIGPNLTDPYWIHGGAPTDIYGTVYEGVLEKGMPAWGASLGAPTVQKVVAYLLTIQDTDVEGGKEAEGELFDPDATGDATADDAAEGAPDDAGSEGTPPATADEGSADPGDVAADGSGEQEDTKTTTPTATASAE